jgi:hypothetical protein
MILFFIQAAEAAPASVYDQSMDSIATIIARLKDSAKQKAVLLKQPPLKLDALIEKIRARLPDNAEIKDDFERVVLEIKGGAEPQPAAAAHEPAEEESEALAELRARFDESERTTLEWSQGLYGAPQVTETDLRSKAQGEPKAIRNLLPALRPLITNVDPHTEDLKKKQTHLRSLEAVHEDYKLLRHNPAAYQNTSVYIVKGVNPYSLCGTKNDQFFHHAVCQIESNFDFLTKGNSLPRSLRLAESNPIALLVRNTYLAKQERDLGINNLQPVFNPVLDDHVGFLAGGILTIQPHNIATLEQIVLDDNTIKNLNICTQESLSIYDTLVTLVFNAAPSFAGIITPQPGSRERRISQKLITLQYKALGQIAAVKSVLKKDHVTLHVTLLGQGTYNNPPDVLREGFATLLDAVKGFNVSIFIHGANDEECDLIRESLGSAESRYLTAEEFTQQH